MIYTYDIIYIFNIIKGLNKFKSKPPKPIKINNNNDDNKNYNNGILYI